jgi:sentrin-specific protease 1
MCFVLGRRYNAVEMLSFDDYVKLVRNSIEFLRNIRMGRSKIESESKLIDEELTSIREQVSVLDVLKGPIPKGVLKKKPRPQYMILSPEERMIADELLSGGDGSSELVASRNNIEVTRDKLTCLRDREWLNDEIINFYFDMLNELGDRKTYLWNSFFWLKLSGDGQGYNYKAVQRWTTRKKVDLFSYERIIVPMNIGRNHWALGVVDLGEKTVCYYDSLAANTIHSSFSEYMIRYLEDEFRDKRRDAECPDFKEFTFPLVEPPQQRNGYDCGVFTCMNAECIVSGRDWIDFDQSMIPDMRRKMIIQIKQGRIR